ncbi:acyl-CoA thioesterase II [Aulographum hederae CBS 113979]|uniref:Acyl-CoA thioesterase II n=1 Tax=Aulographum hederae CBS 113979 TaxID=1176131 RepID=A0A6G1H2Q7_9PEZI|nr:acyl-CoA thioesterase II [Aulographum hederae CBS 113979]
MAEAKTLKETIAVKEIGPNQYESVFPPRKMGNAAQIAYGGCAMAIALNSAYQSVKKGYHVYSMVGHYLGPAMVDRPIFASTRSLRDTRTFATRQIEVSQAQNDGSKRLVMIVLADFQVKEPAMFEYSAPPSQSYSRHQDIPDSRTQLQALVDSKKVPQKMVDMHKIIFGMLHTYFDGKPCPEGIFAQNLTGMAKWLPTSQDNLPLTARTTGDWFKAREPISEEDEQMAALAFVMDGAISFLPLSLDHKFLDDSGACSSLDFALRIMGAVDLNEWHLRELRTVHGGEGRTYSESRLWDESGKMVASMTQQSIMRPKAEKKKASL